jgi:hypothetical protein
MHNPVKPRARLTESDAISIYKLKASASATSVGRLYGVREKAIRDIWKGNTWANETWHLDMSRKRVVKHAGRPAGSRDTRPRKTKLRDESQVTASETNSEQIQLLCPKRPVSGQENMIESVPISASSTIQTLHQKLSFASILMSVDDQLFEWERQTQQDPCYSSGIGCDPFKADWPLHSAETDLSADDSIQFEPV